MCGTRRSGEKETYMLFDIVVPAGFVITLTTLGSKQLPQPLQLENPTLRSLLIFLFDSCHTSGCNSGYSSPQDHWTRPCHGRGGRQPGILLVLHSRRQPLERPANPPIDTSLLISRRKQNQSTYHLPLLHFCCYIPCSVSQPPASADMRQV